MSHQFKKWEEFYSEADEKILRYPNEPLARIMKGNYIPGLDKNYKGKKVLDIGFGHGNNLLFLAQLGFQLYGIEVTPGIGEVVQKRLAQYGYSSTLCQGTNREIPFEHETFDAIVSWDVLHYEGSEENISEAISRAFPSHLNRFRFRRAVSKASLQISVPIT